MFDFVAGSIFAVLLVGIVLRDLSRVSIPLAAITLAYSTAMAVLASRGYFLASSEILPPLALVGGQVLMLVLVVSCFLPGTRAWRAIPVPRFFLWHSFRLPMGIIMVRLVHLGQLAPEFGWGAGIGEILVGLWAVVYLLSPRLQTPRSTVVWCAVGLADVFVGMVTAVLSFRSHLQYFSHSEMMRVMSTIPMVLIPGFSMAVLTISTFLVLLRRKELTHKVR